MVGPFERGTADDAAIAPPRRSPPRSQDAGRPGPYGTLWLTDAWHHLSPATRRDGRHRAARARARALSWKTFEAKLSWGLILTVGASMSLARSMTESGAAAWLGSLFVTQLTTLTISPPVVIALLVVAVAGPSRHHQSRGCMALLHPIAVTIAEAAHLNPLVCGLVVTIAVDAIILYPVCRPRPTCWPTRRVTSTPRRAAPGSRHAAADIVVALLVLPYWAYSLCRLCSP